MKVASLALLTLAAVATAAPTAKPKKGTKIPGQYIVRFKPTTGSSSFAAPRDVDALINEVLGTQANSLTGSAEKQLLHKYDFGAGKLQGFAAKVSAADLAKIKSHPEVLDVEEDAVVTISGSEQITDQGLWGLDAIDGNVDQTYNYPDAGGSGVTAYVIDTGCQVDHPEIQGRATWGASFTGESTNTDGNGHGTHVSGTIGGKTYGVAKAVNIVCVRVLSADGSGSNSGVISGINWVKDTASKKGGKAVANMSLGGGKSSAVDDAAQGLIDAGVALAVAAGNDGTDACEGSPSGLQSAYTVAASDVNNGFASFSNTGSCVDIIAPGVDIKSSWLNSGTNTISGTSMATPHVVGALALAYSTNDFSSPADAYAYLSQNAQQNVIQNAPSGTINAFLDITAGGNNNSNTGSDNGGDNGGWGWKKI